MLTNHRRNLIDENLAYLEQARRLVGSMVDEDYRRQERPFDSGGVGKHVRHVCDFYHAFLAGRTGLVDYAARRRDPRCEQDRDYASAEIARLAGELAGLADAGGAETREADHAVSVRYEGSRSDEVVASTIDRELTFLAQHTVHHYAMIAMILKMLGVSCPDDFGLAPSTLHHRDSAGAGV